ALPMQFEPNVGQADDSVKFLSRGPGYTLLLTPTETVLSLRPGSKARRAKSKAALPVTSQVTEAELRTTLLGANPHTDVEGQEGLPGTVSYFLGNDSNQWR